MLCADGSGIVERLLDTLSEKIGDEVTEEHMLKARKLRKLKRSKVPFSLSTRPRLYCCAH